MTIEELEKKLSELDDLRVELQEQIKEMKMAMVEEEKPIPPHPRWKPKEIENYYVIMSDGTPDTRILHASIDGGMFDRRYSIGNVFKTKEAAEFAAERRKVLAEMWEWAGKWCDTWCIYYTDGRIEPFSVRTFKDITYGEMRFATREDAVNCIEAVGEDRIKKYYFLIPEDKSNA